MSNLRHELAKYLVAGTLAFLSDLAIFILLNKGVGVHYLIANIGGFCIGITVSYLCCIRWVFSHRTYEKVRVEFPVFLAISLLTLMFGELILLILVELAEFQPIVGKIIMTGLIFLVNFIMKKYLLFHRKITVNG